MRRKKGGPHLVVEVAQQEHELEEEWGSVWGRVLGLIVSKEPACGVVALGRTGMVWKHT